MIKPDAREAPGTPRIGVGEFEPFLTVGAGQPQYAETGAHRLLGMLARVEQTVDIGADGKPEGGGLGAQLVRGALGHFRRIATFGLGISPRPRKGATVAAITCRSTARPEPIRGAENADIRCRIGAKSGAAFRRNHLPLSTEIRCRFAPIFAGTFARNR